MHQETTVKQAKELTDLQQLVEKQRAQICDYKESLEQQSLHLHSPAQNLLEMHQLAESQKVQLMRRRKNMPQFMSYYAVIEGS